jgi:hypothetical protein
MSGEIMEPCLKWVLSDKYCFSCGEHVLERDDIWSYDCKTGEPKTIKQYKCFNRRWWQYESHPVTESDVYVFQI